MGGSGNYGHCRLRLEPRARGEGYSFASLVGGDLPDAFVKAVDRGVQSAMLSGVVRGHPAVDLAAYLVHGSYHAEDSNPEAFEIAGATAFRNAARACSPVVLEPIVIASYEVQKMWAETIEHAVGRRGGRIASIKPVFCDENGVSISSKGFANVQSQMLNDWLTAREWTEITAILPLSGLLTAPFSRLGILTARLVSYEPVDESEDEGTAGITVNKPTPPRRGSSGEAVRPEEDD
ncbi:hypothetical protein [Occallatibacter savannae]|uniref:hypothetical protein n=1 Tax=Occallatibacter savannae TaxID=1002691 RepID=UPI001EF6F00D|nr:hypothetical protein [Occallatibacter savannae]